LLFYKGREETVTEEIVSARQKRLTKAANKLVPKALEALAKVAALGKLKPSEEQARKIINALTEGVDVVIDQLIPEDEPEKPSFTL
jgi:hypothetical protein